MPIRIEWGTSDHTLLLWQVVGDFTLEEYLTASKQTALLLQTADHPVTILVDLRKCHHTSHNLIPTIRSQIRHLQSFQGEFIVLSKTQFWQSLYHVAAQCSIGIKLPNIRFEITQDETSDILAAI